MSKERTATARARGAEVPAVADATRRPQ